MTHTVASARAHCLCSIICTPGSWRPILPCCCWHELIGSSSSNKALDINAYPSDPGACGPFGKCAFKNKRGSAKSLWHADNGFTASYRSKVREQTTPSLPGAGWGGEQGRLGNRRCQRGIICRCRHGEGKLTGGPVGSVLEGTVPPLCGTLTCTIFYTDGEKHLLWSYLILYFDNASLYVINHLFIQVKGADLKYFKMKNK